MGIYISTNLFKPKDLEKTFLLLDKVNESIDDEKVGIELFPEWQNEIFEEVVNKNLDNFKRHKITLHGPYYNTEHSEEKGSAMYDQSMDYFMKTLKLSKKLNSSHIVFHHNNCKISNKDKNEMISVSSKNLIELNTISKEYNASIVVENAGVIKVDNMLFDEEEFIEMAKSIENNILIDIGHAFANKWDLKRVIIELKDKIVAYHIHNNDGISDNHNSILDGELDMEEFFKIYKEFTSEADLVIEYGTHCGDDIGGMIRDIKWIKNAFNK